MTGAVLFLSWSAAVAENRRVDVWYPQHKDGQWGYIDSRGTQKVKHHFEVAGDFSEGLAAVRDGGDWGYLDMSGKGTSLPPVWRMADAVRFVLPAGTTEARPMSGSRAWFRKDQRWGLVDSKGQILIEPTYADVGSFSEGLCPVWNGSWGFIDTAGKLVIPLQHYGAAHFSEGLAPVWDKDFKTSYISCDGKRTVSIRVPLQKAEFISRTSVFQEGLAVIATDGVRDRAPRCRFIDRTGTIRLGPFEWAQPFSEGRAVIRCVGERFDRYIDCTGACAFPGRYETAYGFRGGRARVFNGKVYSFLDLSGRLIQPFRDWNAAEDFQNGLARIHIGGQFFTAHNEVPPWWEGGRWVYIDGNGTVVADYQIDKPSSP